MARLLADTNFPRPTAVELQRLGHDLISLDEIGTSGSGSTDDEVLRAAVAADRSFLTLDHRSSTHRAPPGARRPGLIICAFDRDFVGLAHRIHAALSAHDSLDGQIVRVGRRRTVSA